MSAPNPASSGLVSVILYVNIISFYDLIIYLSFVSSFFLQCLSLEPPILTSFQYILVYQWSKRNRSRCTCRQCHGCISRC